MHPSGDPHDPLLPSVTELRALHRYVIESLELQQSEPELREFSSASEFLDRILSVLHGQLEHLDRKMSAFAGARNALQGATATMAGAFLSFLTKTRSRDAAKILRDDYMLLNLVSMQYLILQTRAEAVHRSDISSLAVHHKKEIGGLVEELAELIKICVRASFSPGSELAKNGQNVELLGLAKSTAASFSFGHSAALA